MVSSSCPFQGGFSPQNPTPHTASSVLPLSFLPSDPFMAFSCFHAPFRSLMELTGVLVSKAPSASTSEIRVLVSFIQQLEQNSTGELKESGTGDTQPSDYLSRGENTGCRHALPLSSMSQRHGPSSFIQSHTNFLWKDSFP